MAEDLPSNTLPKARAENDFSRENMTEPETVRPHARQAAERTNHHISGRLEEHEHTDDEQLSIRSNATTENRPRQGIEFDTYAIAYICREHNTCRKKTVKETRSELSQTARTASERGNDNDIHLARCGSFKNDTDTSAFKGKDSNMNTQVRDPNPMYTHNTMNPYPMYAQNDVNPSLMYLQSKTEPNISPVPTFKSNKRENNTCTQISVNTLQQGGGTSFRSTNSDDNHCLQPYAVTRHQEDEVTFTPANNDDNHCLQPYAVTLAPHDDEEAFRPANNDDNNCLQPYAVTNHQDGEAAFRPANNDDSHCLQPYAVTNHHDHEEHDKFVVPCDVIQPYAVRYQEGDDTVGESLNNDDSLEPVNCDGSQPYAVRYQSDDDSGSDNQHTTRGAAPENRQTDSIASEDEDIKPYAAAYMCQQDNNTTSGDPQTGMSSQNQPTVVSNSVNEANPSSNGVRNALPNAQHATACRFRLVYLVMKKAAVLGIWIVCGIFLWIYVISPSPAQPVDTSYTTTTQTESCSSFPTLPAVTIKAKIGDRKLEKITFGGEGTEPGKFRANYGVAVSADSEVFVADYLNKRVQVFSMNGTYLRLFPTVLPGEDRLMYPCSIGQEPGYLWVVVRRYVYRRGVGHVVQYSKNGQPMKKFDVHFISDSSSPVITIDARHDKVIVGEGDTIMMFHPNGSFCRRFKLPKTPGTWMEMRGVATDREGNILLTDYAGVKVYSHSGVKILEIGIRFPLGVCVDSLGRIIVARRDDNRVDMFTRRGEFIRTVGADIEEPWAIAMGPGGQLVVTSKLSNTVTIFPRHMLSF
ncbi:hypothetical protein Bbelb_150100 [Branchiostoma belcheri]|nr:hypothetical protein Bbelb_150100 [Branchiostoma belcheri]